MVTRVIKDSAFIFLKPTMAEVAAELHEPQISDPYLRRQDFICLSPYERYRQQSNSSVNIQLGQDYVVQLVTLCGTVIVDVTDRVFIEEFQHRTTGLTNVYFEMINLPAQSQPVCLKFTAPVLSAKTAFYSNPFVIQDRPRETTRLDYWSRELFDGVDYETTDALLSIRVLGHFTQPKPQEQVQVYSQTSARGSINTQIESIGTELQPWAFTCEYITNAGLRAFQSFRRTPIKYINGIRCTSMATSYETVLGSSNFYRAEWNAFMDETEIYTDEHQIYTPFSLTSFSPSGVYTAQVPNPPSSLSYNTPNVFTIGVSVSPLNPTVSGGKVITYSVSPSLPAGLVLNTTTGLITGTPTAVTANATYTVTATNPAGSDTFGIDISVIDVPQPFSIWDDNEFWEDNDYWNEGVGVWNDSGNWNDLNNW